MLLLYMVYVLHVPGCAVWGFSTWEHVLCPGWCSWGSAGVLWEPHIAFPWTGIRLSATPRRQKAQGNSFDTCEVNFIRNSWAGLESRCFHHVLYQVLTCCAGTAYSLRKSSANSAYSFVVLPGLPYLQKTVYYIIVNHVQFFFFFKWDVCIFYLSNRRAMMWRAHFLHFHHGSSGRSSSSICIVSCRPKTTLAQSAFRLLKCLHSRGKILCKK